VEDVGMDLLFVGETKRFLPFLLHSWEL